MTIYVVIENNELQKPTKGGRSNRNVSSVISSILLHQKLSVCQNAYGERRKRIKGVVIMKSLLKKLLSITALVSVAAVNAEATPTPTLVYRSQGFHGDRQRNVGMVGHINLYDQESWYGTFDMAVGYMRSFRDDSIARCLFGADLQCNDSCSNQILVQGSEVTGRDSKAWLADYLYLNCNYDGGFSISPRIQNVVVDLDFYLGLDEWVNGMYFRIYGPINWSKWQTGFCANDPSTVLTSSCSTGYFTPSGDEVLLDSIAKYFNGSNPVSVDGVTFQPLKFAKMPNCDQTRTGFADLRAELGWNFLQDEDYHLGIGLHVAAPTGNERKAEYVMSPVVGNGNKWELGGTIHGHYLFWKSEDDEKSFGFYVDAVITHLFKSKEQRTMDLKNKPNSRYMLATKFTNTVTNNLSGRTTAGTSATGATGASAQFNNIYAPVANLTTTDYKISIGVQADVVAMFNFSARGFSWDLGYNFWGRSCEDISCPDNCNPCNTDSIFLAANRDTWALKGDARMFGFAGATDSPLAVNDAQALSATQSGADIHAGTNAGSTATTGVVNVKLQNNGVDNAQFAIAGGTPNARLIHTPLTQGGFNTDSNQIKTSIQPVFLKSTDVQLQETKGLSHKVFTHLSYNWDRDNWNPYLGIGGSAEFGKNPGNCDDCETSCSTSSCNTSCDNCVDCSLSQWAIWVKGGVSFN